MNEVPDYDSKYEMENYPEMWMSEIKFIEKTLIETAKNNEILNVLEWGSGFSTIYFSKFLKQNGIPFKWIAIEHFLPWHTKVISMISKNDLSNEVECILINPTSEPDKNIQESFNMDEYINFPSTLDTKFNIIIVDGRKRSECLKTASNVLAADGVAILHDAEREWFHDGFKYFMNGGDFVPHHHPPAARGGVQKLWVGHELK